MKKILALLVAAGMGGSLPLSACTSIIVSGRCTPDGRPLMMKHRDTGTLDNRMEWFKGQTYNFIGLVNSSSAGGEVWAGANEAGFCIMNTATYDLKDDEVPMAQMDREGKVMYRALEICATAGDFRHFLDTLSRPMGVEANFGVVDAVGGASYFEVGNRSWVEFDVNEIGCGYRLVTNFTATGRSGEEKGVERYFRAREIMSDAPRNADGKLEIDALWLLDHLSRSGAPILRDITSASVVFEGVPKNGNAFFTLMWTALGYPATTVAFPLMVLDADRLPHYVVKSAGNGHAEVCDRALEWKGKTIDGKVKNVEEQISGRFRALFRKGCSGALSLPEFCLGYEAFCEDAYQIYCNDLVKVIK